MDAFIFLTCSFATLTYLSILFSSSFNLLFSSFTLANVAWLASASTFPRSVLPLTTVCVISSPSRRKLKSILRKTFGGQLNCSFIFEGVVFRPLLLCLGAADLDLTCPLGFPRNMGIFLFCALCPTWRHCCDFNFWEHSPHFHFFLLFNTARCNLGLWHSAW